MSRIVLITGGQQGIGFGIAQALLEAGFLVAIASLPAARSPAVQRAMQALGNNARYFQHDLQDIARIPKLLDAVHAELGPVTTLVSNAGVAAVLRGDMLDLQPQNYDFVMDVNLRGAFFLAQAVARRMLTQVSTEYRSITFITSVSAALVSVERAEYCISKAGAAMMAGLFAARLAPDGIGVFELRPGIIETEMTAGVKQQYNARIDGGLVPAGRWGQPSDIGQVMVPIAEGRMGFANGAVIAVDGGLSIHRI